jgi:transposase
MPQPNDLSRSLVALDQNSSIIAVVEMSQSSWLVGGVLPGIERQPRKKLEPSPERLLALLHRWREKRSRPAAPSRGLRWPSKPAATAFGCRAGLRRVE